MMTTKFEDNSRETLRQFGNATDRILDEIGREAERYAKENITKAGRVDTGRLRNSITHKVFHNAVYIGTNVKYGPYIENGTGIYADSGMGRKDPWVYMDEKGKFHLTRGIKPTHFLKNAATKHAREYKAIAQEILKNWLY